MPSPMVMATGPRPPMTTECPAACQAEARGVTAGGADNAYSLLADLSLWSALGLLILTSFALISAVSTASRQPHHAVHALFFTTLL